VKWLRYVIVIISLWRRRESKSKGGGRLDGLQKWKNISHVQREHCSWVIIAGRPPTAVDFVRCVYKLNEMKMKTTDHQNTFRKEYLNHLQKFCIVCMVDSNFCWTFWRKNPHFKANGSKFIVRKTLCVFFLNTL